MKKLHAQPKEPAQQEKMYAVSQIRFFIFSLAREGKISELQARQLSRTFEERAAQASGSDFVCDLSLVNETGVRQIFESVLGRKSDTPNFFTKLLPSPEGVQ